MLDSGARGATTTFAQRGIGDVLLAWENEAFLALNELGKDKLEMVVPSMSILAEPPVTVVDKVANRRGTAAVARAYLEYLYSPEGQEIAAKHFYRPRLKEVADKYASRFPRLTLFTIDELFGGWQKAQKKHFEEGGTFDQILPSGPIVVGAVGTGAGGADHRSPWSAKRRNQRRPPTQATENDRLRHPG